MKSSTFANLDVQEVVIGARSQQETPRCVGKFTVVDLLIMFHVKDPQQHGLLYIKHLKAPNQKVLTWKD